MSHTSQNPSSQSQITVVARRTPPGGAQPGTPPGGVPRSTPRRGACRVGRGRQPPVARSPLARRMLQDLQLAGHSERTQEAYL